MSISADVPDVYQFSYTCPVCGQVTTVLFVYLDAKLIARYVGRVRLAASDKVACTCGKILGEGC